jgi:hypothetical protein
MKKWDAAMIGGGESFVDVFDTDANLLRRFAQRGVLDAPWRVVLAPNRFGQFSNDILIGNFGDGKSGRPRESRFRNSDATVLHDTLPLPALWTILG